MQGWIVLADLNVLGLYFVSSWFQKLHEKALGIEDEWFRKR